VGSKLEKSRSSSSLLACRPQMFHCKIIGIKNQKGFWLSESESALSTSVSRVEYQLFVGSSESDLGGLVSFGLPDMGTLYTSGVYIFCDFQPISGYVWETIQDRAIVTVER